MAANFVYRSYALPFEAACKEWHAAVEQSRHEDGASYSGAIGCLNGAPDKRDLRLESRQAAVDYVQENHEKWEPPLAVSYRGGDAAKEAARKLDADRSAAWDRYHVAERKMAASLRGKITCSACGSVVNRDKQRHRHIIRCPVCEDQFGLLSLERAELESLLKEAEWLRDAPTPPAPKDAPIEWLFGGHAPS